MGKTLSFQCRGCRFHPLSGNQDPACPMEKKKKKMVSAPHLAYADQYVGPPKVLKLFSHSTLIKTKLNQNLKKNICTHLYLCLTESNCTSEIGTAV